MNIEDLLATYRAVFSTDDGEIVLADLQKRFHLSATTFERGDPHFSAFLEGQRSVVLTILSMMEERGADNQDED